MGQIPGAGMSGLVESALAILAGSGHRTRIASENIGNMTTPGYKARVAFRGMASGEAITPPSAADMQISSAQGPLRATGNQFDLAIQGGGFFVVVSEGGQIYYTRQGHLQRAEDGRLMSPAGEAAQQTGGGDLIVQGDRVEITADGVVLDGNQPVGQIAVVEPIAGAQLEPVSGSIFAAAETGMVEAATAGIRQGMIEGSNVSLGDEMLGLMTATRQAETGARLVQVYDELMGRAFSTLGQRG